MMFAEMGGGALMSTMGKRTGRAVFASLLLTGLAGFAAAQVVERVAVPSCPACAAFSMNGRPLRAEPWPDEAPAPLPVAIFGEDGRQRIWDLLRRDPGTLSVEERAILQAAGRIGTVACRSGSSNATLIRLADGRDAVVTSAHAFIDANGPKCDLTTVTYMPNTTLYMGGDFTDFVLRAVPTTGELPLNHDNQAFRPSNMATTRDVGIEYDFLIFPLADTISTDSLPDGSSRGFMRMATDIPSNGMAILIGSNRDFLDGLARSYEGCAYQNASVEFYHLCATSDTSSSSPLMLLAGRELVLAAMHSRAYTWYGNEVVPVPSNLVDGNIGVNMDTVRTYLDSIGLPAITAPAAGAGPGVKDEVKL